MLNSRSSPCPCEVRWSIWPSPCSTCRAVSPAMVTEINWRATMAERKRKAVEACIVVKEEREVILFEVACRRVLRECWTNGDEQHWYSTFSRPPTRNRSSLPIPVGTTSFRVSNTIIPWLITGSLRWRWLTIVSARNKKTLGSGPAFVDLIVPIKSLPAECRICSKTTQIEIESRGTGTTVPQRHYCRIVLSKFTSGL